MEEFGYNEIVNHIQTQTHIVWDETFEKFNSGTSVTILSVVLAAYMKSIGADRKGCEKFLKNFSLITTKNMNFLEDSKSRE